MKICNTYSHLYALDKLKSKNTILKEIEEIVNEPQLLFGINRPEEIKSKINLRFNDLGWTDKAKVGNSRLTISFLKNKVGVCFQLGNVARTYADILKLAQMGKKNVIDVGIIIVPHKIESKMLGANYAQYDRLATEIKHFEDIINVPILVIGLSN
ncbi:BglII/BstYI family type II restriction endonuclease [Fluviicola sp.]|uniref:BglII/BstYI family type II restriction endonuclease n=1 Tax=Fluviicola sp. TaxID=1917219 RepID=UPI0031E340F1